MNKKTSHFPCQVFTIFSRLHTIITDEAKTAKTYATFHPLTPLLNSPQSALYFLRFSSTVICLSSRLASVLQELFKCEVRAWAWHVLCTDSAQRETSAMSWNIWLVFLCKNGTSFRILSTAVQELRGEKRRPITSNNQWQNLASSVSLECSLSTLPNFSVSRAARADRNIRHPWPPWEGWSRSWEMRAQD